MNRRSCGALLTWAPHRHQHTGVADKDLNIPPHQESTMWQPGEFRDIIMYIPVGEPITVDREIFAVKNFSPVAKAAKIKCAYISYAKKHSHGEN